MTKFRRRYPINVHPTTTSVSLDERPYIHLLAGDLSSHRNRIAIETLPPSNHSFSRTQLIPNRQILQIIVTASCISLQVGPSDPHLCPQLSILYCSRERICHDLKPQNYRYLRDGVDDAIPPSAWVLSACDPRDARQLASDSKSSLAAHHTLLPSSILLYYVNTSPFTSVLRSFHPTPQPLHLVPRFLLQQPPYIRHSFLRHRYESWIPKYVDASSIL